MQFPQTNEKGSLTLEAALVLPPVLAYVALLFALSLSLRADMIWQEAAWSAIQEVSLGLALLQNDQYSQKIESFDLKEIGLQFLTDGVSGKSLQNRQMYWFKQNSKNSKLMGYFIQEPYGFIYRSEDKGDLYYSYSYRLPMAPGDVERSFRLPLPYWGGYDADNKKLFEDEGASGELSNIWSEHVFARGQYFRELEGANLPAKFPVIAYFGDGTAKSIKSIDLTAPTYQDAAALIAQVREHADKLANYDGTENFGSANINVRASEITKRVLHLVIPENSSQDQLAILTAEKVRMQSQGILLEWVSRGVSTKYGNED